MCSGVFSGSRGMKLFASRKYPPMSGMKNMIAENTARKPMTPTMSLTV
jgi:hypothetical protein